jgi:hypothetical protein
MLVFNANSFINVVNILVLYFVAFSVTMMECLSCIYYAVKYLYIHVYFSYTCACFLLLSICVVLTLELARLLLNQHVKSNE